MLWCCYVSLDNQLITLQMSHYDGRVTHVTMEMGVPGLSFSRAPFQFYLNILFDCFILICCSQTAKDKRLTINPLLLCVFFS